MYICMYVPTIYIYNYIKCKNIFTKMLKDVHMQTKAGDDSMQQS